MFIYKNDKGITTLIVVFLIGFMGLGMALTITTIALLGINKNYNTTSGNQSFYTAEAAAREGIYQYIHNPSYSGGDSPLINNAILATINVTPLVWPYVEIKGIAENNLTYREVIYTLTEFPEGLAFNHAVFSENDMNLGGSATINGNVFVGNIMSFNGSKAKINGDAFSPNDISDTDNINGTAYSGVIPIPSPQIDLEDYYDVATFPSTSSGEVKGYLNNEIRIDVIFASTTDKISINSNNTSLTGSLVTKGDLSISGGTYTATDNYAAIIVEGDLTLTGGGSTPIKITGIVYVKGKTTLTGGGNIQIRGSLISLGGLTNIGGNSEIIYDKEIVEGWADTLGLSTSTLATSPRIIGWGEQ